MFSILEGFRDQEEGLPNYREPHPHAIQLKIYAASYICPPVERYRIHPDVTAHDSTPGPLANTTYGVGLHGNSSIDLGPATRWCEI